MSAWYNFEVAGGPRCEEIDERGIKQCPLVAVYLLGPAHDPEFGPALKLCVRCTIARLRVNEHLNTGPIVRTIGIAPS